MKCSSSAILRILFAIFSLSKFGSLPRSACIGATRIPATPAQRVRVAATRKLPDAASELARLFLDERALAFRKRPECLGGGNRREYLVVVPGGLRLCGLLDLHEI